MMVKTNSWVFSLLKSNLFLIFLTVAVGTGIWFYERPIRFPNEFRIEKIEFDGQEHVPEILLLKASGLRYKNNIFNISVDNVKEKLEQISWIKSVSVQRKLPNKISVRVAERVPIAIYQLNYKLYLIDIDGKILENDGIGDFDNLPIIVGEGAEKVTRQFLYVLGKFPKIQNQLAFAVYVGKRRWNMKINKGITVKLPEKHLGYAMQILDEIAGENGFFNDDIQGIDLRNLDRVIVKKRVNVSG